MSLDQFDVPAPNQANARDGDLQLSHAIGWVYGDISRVFPVGANLHPRSEVKNKRMPSQLAAKLEEESEIPTASISSSSAAVG